MNLELLDILVCPYSKSAFTLEALEREHDEIEFGILSSEAGEFPIVAGIPILLPDNAELVEHVRKGRFQEAVMLAVIGKAPPAGLWHVARWLQDTHRFRALGKTLQQPRQKNWENMIRTVLFPEDGSQPSAWQLYDLAFRKCRIRPAEVFNYSYYRHGLPSHLVALSFIETIHPQDKLVLDLACGSGHITHALQRKVAPRRVIGLDSFFFYLYVARTQVAPEAWYVCADILSLPFREATFSLIFCSDALFNFQAKWSSLREMERTSTDDATLMILWLTNRLQPQSYKSRSFAPAGYRELVKHLPHRLIPDRLTTERYLKKQGLAACDQVDQAVLDASHSLSILAFKGDAEFVDHGSFDKWPHAQGELGINPLFVLAQDSPSQATYVRRFPSDYYRDGYPELQQYLPEHFELTASDREALRQGRADDLERLISQFAVMGFPPNYLRQPS